jgi:hypothetical protein
MVLNERMRSENQRNKALSDRTCGLVDGNKRAADGTTGTFTGTRVGIAGRGVR